MAVDGLNVKPSTAAGAVPVAGENVGAGDTQRFWQYLLSAFGGEAAPTPVTAAAPLPTTDAAVAAALASMLTELGQKLEAGGEVALSAATLAALESVTVGGTVALDSASLTALEQVTVGGTVALDSASLTALEQVTATISGQVETRDTGIAPPLGYQQASLTAAAALPAVPAGAAVALIVPRAPVRWRDDGTNPTATVGMYLAADQSLAYEGNLAAFRMIAESGTVEVNISYYGEPA